ncbi:FAST kinase domain-containing protein 3, mitochondrial-like [Hyposmocoma kahamanoa]|uniref:FAST kinase domain-containing protein 3, mitochondrial-like n=1 Tax=Hyposmocoma kahamanoa TaxID=1477025 RepID=UPI000E6D6DD3|nr:FAST kinase domain-containing protein 3, mitochondrial-like [Hyposmocoma kahamanoa]
MSIVLRSYLKVKNNVLSVGSSKSSPVLMYVSPLFTRHLSEDKTNSPEFINSSILMENGMNVQELPLIVRKLTNIAEIDEKSTVEDPQSAPDNGSYHLIQAEFKQCVDLRDVFSLLSKCTKITPNIALGAMERIYDIEKNPMDAAPMLIDSNTHINMAKGAILDKLLKVIIKTEDTQTTLNILKTISNFMDPYKHKFCEELLFRVIDNKLSILQICEFLSFLINNRSDPRYSEIIDKLWIGFVQKEADINEVNIVKIFTILPGLKVSKRTILTLLEQKFADLWSKIKVPVMQEILNTFLEVKYSSMQSFAVVGTWIHKNIHALDEESFLDIVTKVTRLNYTDDHIEKAIEKYIKLKGPRIQSPIVIVSILNYCMQFQIRNEQILNACSEYFLTNGNVIPASFLKSFIYPFGYLYFDPIQGFEFWQQAERVLEEKFDKISADDLASMILSFIFVGKHPLELVKRMLSPEYLVRINNPQVMKKFHLVDTALSLECKDYSIPLLPKDQWSKFTLQDSRVRNIIDKIKDTLQEVAGGVDNYSTCVFIPNLHFDETYLIDIMLHPAGLGSNNFNWKLKSGKNVNTAILIHLPDHYCSDNKQLIGPQVMKKRHLKILSMKVVSLKYSIISKFYTSFNTSDLKKYLIASILNAEPCM